MNTSQKIERVNRLAASERLAGPEKINAAQTITGGGIHDAYCKTSPSTGNTLQCYLGTDETGLEITVYFTIMDASGGGNNDLNKTHWTLGDGVPIPVKKRSDGKWWCIVPLETTVEKDC